MWLSSVGSAVVTALMGFKSEDVGFKVLAKGGIKPVGVGLNVMAEPDVGF